MVSRRDSTKRAICKSTVLSGPFSDRVSTQKKTLRHPKTSTSLGVIIVTSIVTSTASINNEPRNSRELRGFKNWRPHGDSNPGSHRERVVSWTRLDDGD